MLLVGDISTLPNNKETQRPVQRSPRNQAAQNLSSHPATRARCRHFQGPAPSCRAQTSPVKSRQKIRLQNTHLVSTKSRWQKPPRHEVKHGLWICTSLTRKVGRCHFHISRLKFSSHDVLQRETEWSWQNWKLPLSLEAEKKRKTKHPNNHNTIA